MIVWVSERGHAQPDVRIKVNPTHGPRSDYANLATVAVPPVPRLVAGQLSPNDFAAVSEWIRLNENVIVGYWESRIYTDDLLAQLQRLP